jgi:hypothetical protein
MAPKIIVVFLFLAKLSMLYGMQSRTRADSGPTRKSLTPQNSMDSLGELPRRNSTETRARFLSVLKINDYPPRPKEKKLAPKKCLENFGAVNTIYDKLSLEERINLLAYRDDYNRSPLILAVLSDAPILVTKYLDAGEDPNYHDRDGYTALHYAVLFDRKPNNTYTHELRLEILDIFYKNKKVNSCLTNNQGAIAYQFLKSQDELYILHIQWFNRYMIELTVEGFLLEHPNNRAIDQEKLQEFVSLLRQEKLNDQPCVCEAKKSNLSCICEKISDDDIIGFINARRKITDNALSFINAEKSTTY